ncbi:MAG TPA: hypothetical protein VII66_06515, partial [Gemmatimonadaceae bacterium]
QPTTPTKKINRGECAIAVGQLAATTAGDVAFFTGVGAGARLLILSSREARLGAMFAEGAAQGVAHLRTASSMRGLAVGSFAVAAQAQWGSDGIWTTLSSGANHWRDFVPGFDWWEAYKGAREACSPH